MTGEAYKQLHYSLFAMGGEFRGCAWALSETELITCAHVATDSNVDLLARRSFCKNDQATFIVARTTGVGDPLSDATLLTLKRPGGASLPSPHGQGICEPETGQLFSAFGFPNDKPTLGDFASYEIGRQLPNGWFQVVIYDLKGSELREGYSGAPAWDPVLGCVIGIVVGVDPLRRRQIAYIIPPSILRDQIGAPASQKYPLFGPALYDRIAAAGLRGSEVRRIERYLSTAADSDMDSVQRYWIYACLGELSPDDAALKTLRQATKTDSDEFALTGALEALSKFPQSNDGEYHGLPSRLE